MYTGLKLVKCQIVTVKNLTIQMMTDQLHVNRMTIIWQLQYDMRYNLKLLLTTIIFLCSQTPIKFCEY